jgi:myosin tail region-interacting protein MTI1
MSSHPFKVKAVFEYSSQIDEDLNFPEGQIITVTEDDEDDWYTGEYVDATGVKKEGIFPRNFVEKYEPTAPPRPTRAPRPKKDVEPPPAAASEPISQSTAKKEPPQEQPREEIRERSINAAVPQPALPVSETPSSATAPSQTLPIASPLPPKSAAASKPSAPPPVSEKPSGGSFRDRIAAFNKGAAPPPAPFKPGGLSSGGSSFIKKPFVAPPPSKDAYIPPPREPVPQKIYRREEDPEIAAKEAENQENAERAGLSPTNEGDAEDQPKPTSLKERIALLQKQQQEQAARHADAAQKKEKPKRTPKKRTESHTVGEEQEEGEEAPLERQDSHGTVGKKSMESGHEEHSTSRAVPVRKASKGPPAIPSIPRESYGDGNDADMSGAGDETEEPEESTGRDDSDERPKARAVAAKPDTTEEEEDDANNQGEAAEDEEEEEEDVDPEVRRREELRARMAKMSGGMGMMGMFGGGMPMPGPSLPTRKRTSGASDKKQSNEYAREDVNPPSGNAPPVPSIPLPGLARMKSPEESNKHPEVEREDEIQHGTITETRPAHEVPDVEDVAHAAPAPPIRAKGERPQGTYDTSILESLC